MGFRSWADVCWSVGVAAILAAVLVAGCESRQQRSGFRPANVAGGQFLPGRQYLVGGGINIEWKAPEPGTVFLVEKKTGKLVETRSLDGGDVFSFVVDSTVRAQELGEIIGINLAKTQFLLYFEPGGAVEEPPMGQARAMGRQGER